jgi:hypothetical protein
MFIVFFFFVLRIRLPYSGGSLVTPQKQRSSLRCRRVPLSRSSESEVKKRCLFLHDV